MNSKIAKIEDILASLITSDPSEHELHVRQQENDTNVKQNLIQIHVEELNDDANINENEYEYSFSFQETLHEHLQESVVFDNTVAENYESQISNKLTRSPLSTGQDISSICNNADVDIPGVQSTLIDGDSKITVYTVPSYRKGDIIENKTKSLEDITFAEVHPSGRPKGAIYRSIGLPISRAKSAVNEEQTNAATSSGKSSPEIDTLQGVTAAQVPQINLSIKDDVPLLDEEPTGSKKITLESSIESAPIVQKKLAIKYTSLQKEEKIQRILAWLVADNRELFENIMNGHRKIMRKEMNNLIVRGLSDQLLSVNVNLVKAYCEPDAFSLLKKEIVTNKKNGSWKCPHCANKLKDNSIQCEACLHWWDMSCTGLTAAPRGTWFGQFNQQPVSNTYEIQRGGLYYNYNQKEIF